MKKIYLMGLSALFALAVNAQTTIRIKSPLTRHNQETGKSNAKQSGGINSIAQVNGNLTCTTQYSAGTTMNLVFNFTQTGNTDEWIDMFTLTFPAGITPVSSPNSTFPTANAAGGAEPLNPVAGQVISWGVDVNDGYGGINTTTVGVTFTVNVTIGAGVTGNQTATFLASGDTYTTAANPTPGNLNGTAIIYPAGAAVTNLLSRVVGVLTSTATAANAQNCGLATHSVVLQVNNLGTAAESNIPANYSINGVAATPIVYPGSIPAGDSALIVFPATYNFSAQNVYNIKAWTALSGDIALGNDTTTATITNSTPVALTSAAYSNGIESTYDYNSLNLDWTGTGLPFGPSAGTFHSGAQALFYTVNMTTIGAPAGTYEAFINLPCMNVVNGETYRISYWKKANTSGTLTVNGQSAVFTGTAQTGADMTTVLKAYSPITANAQAGAWTKDSVDYVATATETRYFAIGGKGTLATTADQINVRIDDINITKVTGPVGIKENSKNLLSIFPNPSNGLFTLNTPENNSSVEVYNVIGENVYSKSQLTKGDNTIDLSNMAAGSYILKVKAGNELMTKRIVISK